MYRALVETRSLGLKLGRGLRLPHRLEACWAGTAIDLRPDDLTSSGNGETLNDYIRGVGRREGGTAVTIAAVRNLLASKVKPFAGTSADRLLCTLGAAIAFKGANARQVAMAYVSARDLSSADWKRLVAAAGRADLPLILVVTPSKNAERPIVPGIPVIPVDAGDAVALYRVAQESIVRARGEDGMVAIECVATGADPVTMLGRQLVSKGIATERWVEGVEKHFRRTLARL